jgi:hypothetical protein
MPVPDFSPGEVLTAAAMDSIGLWKVAEGALSGSTTDFVGCFTSDFDNYRIVINSIAFNIAGDLYFRFLNGTTPLTTATYRYSYLGINAAGTGLNNFNNGFAYGYTGVSNDGGANGLEIGLWTFDLMNVTAAQRSIGNSHAVTYSGAFGTRVGLAMNNTTAAHDGIQLTTASAATVTGNVVIYGYRK